MNLALILLKTGPTLIAQSDELDYEPRCHLVEPYEVSGKTKVILTPWPSYTDEKHVLLNSEDLLTVTEPNQQVKDAYLKKIGKTEEELQSKQKKVLLNEENLVPPEPEDPYEPHYIESDY
jgi:hypothetical protein